MHCPECGFVNAEGANYCQKCGAFLGEPEEGKKPVEVTQGVEPEAATALRGDG